MQFLRFIEDLQFAAFRMVNFFDDISDQVDAYNTLFRSTMKTNDKLHRNAYKFLRQEVKRESVWLKGHRHRQPKLNMRVRAVA